MAHTAALVQLKLEIHDFSTKLCAALQNLSEKITQVWENQQNDSKENRPESLPDIISIILMDTVPKLHEVENLLKLANMREAFVSHFMFSLIC